MTQQTIEQAITNLKTAMEGEDATRWIDDLLPSHMKDIIVVLEIPHRSDPRTWIAFSEEELLSKVDAVGYDYERFGDLTKETAIEFIKHDLHSGQVFEGREMLSEMDEYIQSGDGHGYGLAKIHLISEIEFITGQSYFRDIYGFRGMGEEDKDD